MTKRIDFKRSNKAKYGWEVKYDKNDFIIVNQNDEKLVLKHRSWEITVNFKLSKINFISTSKAKIKTRNTFEMTIRSGSLFLYNSSLDWYWYFRNAGLQNKLDKLGIDRIIQVNNQAEIKEVYYHRFENGKCLIDEEKSLMVFPAKPEYYYIQKAIIQPYETQNGQEQLSPNKYMIHDISFIVDSKNPFLIIYNKPEDLCSLYILNKYKISNIPELECINDRITNHMSYLEL